MGNYTRTYNPQPTQRVGSAELKAEFSAIETAFNTEASEAERTLRQTGGSAVNALPNAASRALKVLSFDASGHPRATIAETDLAAAVTAAATATTQAGIATTQAGIATTQAGNASTSASTATTQAGIATTGASTATTQAGIATTQASNASSSASSASTDAGTASTAATTATAQAGIATTQAGIATTQAGIATTQASNASSSASSASTSASTATTKAGEANASAIAAAASAASIAGGPVTSVNGMTGVVTGVATQSGTETLTNKTFTGYTETVYNLTGTAIDPANGTIQYKTLSGNTTFTESLADGQSVVLMLNPGTYTTTWFSATWIGSAASAAPTLVASVYNCITFFQFGGTLYGKYEGRV